MITAFFAKCRLPVVFLTLLTLGALAAPPSAAPQHRATRLGNPATRFADPLQTIADLRRTLLSEALRTDVRTILGLSGYQGEWEDFRKAVAEGPIAELKIPVGTRLPAMSSRENGKAILLRDVLWAGKEPIDAYEFFFTSNGRRYRVVMPKPCSNFWVEPQEQELPVARAGLELTPTLPAEATVCAPLDMTVMVRNSGNTVLTGIQATVILPAGLQTIDRRSTLTLDAGTQQPGYGLKYAFKVQAAGPGKYDIQIRATAAEGATVQTSAGTVVRGPALAIDCRAPAEVLINRPAQVCLTVRNTGDAPEPTVTVALPIPAGAVFVSGTGGAAAAADQVMWTLTNAKPGASTELCAVFTSKTPASLTFAAAAHGTCAPPVESRCATRVAGVPGILLEVSDLNDPIEVGKEETYVITVTNQGSASLTNIKVVCALEETQEYVSATGATAVQATGRTITMAPLPELSAKQQASWRVVVKALTAGDVRFTTNLSCDQFKHTVQETEATTQF